MKRRVHDFCTLEVKRKVIETTCGGDCICVMFCWRWMDVWRPGGSLDVGTWCFRMEVKLAREWRGGATAA